MEQHAVPQNITAYEFRLVGDMTLKQFLELAAGIVIGLVIFRLPLPGIIKYPLVGLSVITGILMAFVPVNGRPFNMWLMAFIRAIYAPTQFNWRLTPPAEIANSSVSTLPTQPVITKPATPEVPPIPTIILPKKPSETSPNPTPAPLSPSSKVDSIPTAILPTTPTPIPTSPNSETTFNKIDSVPTPKPLPEKTTDQKPSASTPPTVSTNNTTQTPTPVTTQPTPINLPPVTPLTTNPLHPLPTPSTANPAPTTHQINAPTQQNILAGIVTDNQNNALEGVIVEIIDSVTHIPVRALRTNRAGIFQIATALTPGSYLLHSEKEGFTFTEISVKINNSIISPIIITANKNA